MQNVSKAYKEHMKEPLRNKTYMRVTMGVFNHEAYESSSLDRESVEDFSSSPMDGEAVNKVYASYEEHWNTVDGSLYFRPKNGTMANQGTVTKELASEHPAIRIDFLQDDPVSLKGVTIKFSERSYPTRLEIETDNGTVEYQNASSFFQTEDTFDDITFLSIRALEMSRGNTRMRITSIEFGIGLTMTDSQIISTKQKSHVSSISEDLPTIDFSITVENMNHYYNVDNDDSVINYMNTEQEVQVYYGQGLNDGTIEWFRSATLKLKDWKADDTTATFTATESLEYLSTEYERGRYYPEGISAFDLAVDVFDVAGVDPSGYWIDPYLKTVMIYNPMPSGPCKECLQLIANASRSILTENAMGVIVIRSAFIPEVSSSANAETPYSDATSIMNNEDVHEYASYEPQFTLVNGSQFFIPRSTSGMVKCGFVSEAIANTEGLFDENPIVTLSMESAATFFNMQLRFGQIAPVQMTIKSYNDNTLIESFVYEPTSKVCVISHTFSEVDKIELEFVKANPHCRVHLMSLSFGDVTDYRLTYDELKKDPEGTKLEKVKQLKMARTIYTPGSEQKDLISEDFDMPSETTEYEFTFSQAVHDLTVTCDVNGDPVNVDVQVIEQSTYHCKVRLSNPPAEPSHATMTIHGYEYNISIANEIIKLNAAGKEIPFDNPLISSATHAKEVGQWVGEYYAAGNEYEFDFRGDPAIEANDLMYFQSMYKENLMVRVEDISTEYSGSIKGQITARRMI